MKKILVLCLALCFNVTLLCAVPNQEKIVDQFEKTVTLLNKQEQALDSSVRKHTLGWFLDYFSIISRRYKLCSSYVSAVRGQVTKNAINLFYKKGLKTGTWMQKNVKNKWLLRLCTQLHFFGPPRYVYAADKIVFGDDSLWDKFILIENAYLADKKDVDSLILTLKAQLEVSGDVFVSDVETRMPLLMALMNQKQGAEESWRVVSDVRAGLRTVALNSCLYNLDLTSEERDLILKF